MKKYKFSEDKLMQDIGNLLFGNGNYLTESTNSDGKRVLSFLIIEEDVYRERAEALNPRNASITVYPEFDDNKDCYNIIVTISIYTKQRNSSYDYILYGETDIQKQEQINILEALLDKELIMEIWFKGRHSKLTNWVAPVVNKEIFHEDLIKKIIKWNKRDISTCNSCGREISKLNDLGICGDCYSKQIVVKNHS